MFRQLFRLIPRRGSMASKLAFRSPLSTVNCQQQRPADIYVSADRLKFYRSIGVFCLLQGSAWSMFAAYLFSRSSLKTVTWESISADLMTFNKSLAAKLESWTPEPVAKAILRPRQETQTEQLVAERKPAVVVEEEVVVAERKPAVVVVEEEEGPLILREAKHLAEQMRSAVGVITPEEAKNNPNAVSSKAMVPFVCTTLGLFTFFVGGVVPTRVIRRISLLPKRLPVVANTANTENLVRVSTYGSFGIFPRRGVSFDVPLESIRLASAYREGNKFMNLLIGRRLFAFYLERFEAEYILPEYFEHLNSKMPIN